MPMFSEEAIQSCCATYFDSIGLSDAPWELENMFAMGIRYAGAIMGAEGMSIQNVQYVVVNEVGA